VGPQHSRTLHSAAFLSQVLIKQTKYKEAEELSRRALEGREKVLGKDHPDTLDSVYGLAYLLPHLCGYDEALTLYQKALLGCTEALGSVTNSGRFGLPVFYSEAMILRIGASRTSIPQLTL
jgi:tetratricopeptide (TPR) repeat protein